MTEIMVLLALSICLALLAAFLLICYSDYRRMKRENRQVSGKMRKLEEMRMLRIIKPLSTHFHTYYNSGFYDT